MKLLSDTATYCCVSDLNLNASLNLKVDTHNRFMCFNAKPIVGARDALDSVDSGRVLYIHQQHDEEPPRRSSSVTTLECPADRVTFHKTFSALINLHTNTEKKKKKDDNSSMIVHTN